MSEAETLRKAYVDLIKRAVSNYLYLGGDRPFGKFRALDHYEDANWVIDPLARPASLLTRGQLDLIEQAVLLLETEQVPGNYIEAGVWRGGAVILLRALLDAHAIPDRRVFAADSFCGIPRNTKFRHDPVDLWPDRWAASLAEVRSMIARFGLLDERIEFVEGLFADSLPALSDEQFALIRLDSDSYDSVMTSLELLYPLLSPGGIVIVDDWHLPGCRFAVDAYRKHCGIVDPVSEQAGNGWWRKGDAARR